MSNFQSHQEAQERGSLCLDHENRIVRNSHDITEITRTCTILDGRREEAVRRVHKRIDTMQWSIVGAMFTVIIEGIILIFSLLRGG